MKRVMVIYTVLSYCFPAFAETLVGITFDSGTIIQSGLAGCYSGVVAHGVDTLFNMRGCGNFSLIGSPTAFSTVFIDGLVAGNDLGSNVAITIDGVHYAAANLGGTAHYHTEPFTLLPGVLNYDTPFTFDWTNAQAWLGSSQVPDDYILTNSRFTGSGIATVQFLITPSGNTLFFDRTVTTYRFNDVIVPEPSPVSLCLFGLGLLSIVGVRRRYSGY